MGQAKKRAAEIQVLKAANPTLSNKLQAAAIHECGHALANFHYEIPFGDEGLWLMQEHGEVKGFSDSRPSEKFGAVNAPDFLRDDPEGSRAYLVSSLAGPLAEFYFWFDEGRPPDRILAENEDAWLNDFAVLLGIKGTEREHGVLYDSEQLKQAQHIFNWCMKTLFGALGWIETPKLPPVMFSDQDVSLPFRNAVIEAMNLVNLYQQEIHALAEHLLAAPNTRLAKAQLYAWAAKNFDRKNLREHIRAATGGANLES
jgi:hypothetical protein